MRMMMIPKILIYIYYIHKFSTQTISLLIPNIQNFAEYSGEILRGYFVTLKNSWRFFAKSQNHSLQSFQTVTSLSLVPKLLTILSLIHASKILFNLRNMKKKLGNIGFHFGIFTCESILVHLESRIHLHFPRREIVMYLYHISSLVKES